MGLSPTGSGSGAPTDATYLTQTPNSSLSAEQAMSALGTGIVKNTTATGVQSIITPGTGVETALGVNIGSAGAPVLFNGAGGTPSSLALTNATGLLATGGGTGQSTYTKGDLLASPGSNTLNKLAVGTDGQVLTADAASTNGVKWAAAGGGANTVTTSVLLSSTTVNLNEGTGAKQTLYTCPSSRRAVITNIVMQKFSGTPASAVIKLGWNAASDDVVLTLDFGASNQPTTSKSYLLSVFDTAISGSALSAIPTIGTAADILGLSVTAGEGSALTAIVQVFGFLTDVAGVEISNVNGSGDGVAISPASVTTGNITLSGSLTGSTAVVATVSSVDINTTTPQDVYTVPDGKTFIVTLVAFTNPSVDLTLGSASNLRVYESTTGLQMGSVAIVGASSSRAALIVRPASGTGALTIAAGDKVQVRPDTAYGAAATVTVRVTGILF